MIILMAVFLEFLLPNNALHRYVKVVISLFVLFTILSPIVDVLKINISDHDLEVLPLSTRAQTTQGESLDEIVKQGNQLKQEEMKKSLQIVEQRMEEQFMKDASQLIEHTIRNVDVQMAMDKDVIEVTSVSVTVQVNEKQPQTKEKPYKPIQSVQMNPVQIEIEPVTIFPETNSMTQVSLHSQNDESIPNRSMDKIEAAIRGYALQQWNVPGSLVTVEISN